jgi:hypothetical protein
LNNPAVKGSSFASINEENKRFKEKFGAMCSGDFLITEPECTELFNLLF